MFCRRIVQTGKGSFGEIRQTLRQKYKLPIPGRNSDGSDYSRDQHRQAFAMFLDFLKANLAGQTAIRIDQTWATQSAVIEGMASFALPDVILREDEIATELPALARRLGHPDPGAPRGASEDTPYPLSAIYDEEIEQKAADVYSRDYLMFGFGKWG